MRPDPSAVRTSHVALVCVLFASFAVSCGGSGAPTEPTPVVDRTPIRVVAGAGQTDTVLATLPQALIVEVRDTTGKLSPGRTVRFTAITLPAGTTGAVVRLSPLDQQAFGPFSSNDTDAQGRAKTLVQMGTVAGTASLEISVPELGVSDTISFSVKPGAPARLNVAPRDTTIQPAATYALRSAVTDQFSNPIAGLAPTYSATSVSVSPSGQVTAGSTFAAGTIVATFGKVADTVRVSVLPQLPMVANRWGTVVVVNSDGTGEKAVVTTSDWSLSPHSVKTTPSIVYYTGDPYYSGKVWVVEPGAVPRRLLPTASGFEAWPRLSPDGVWVYFVRNNNTLWRAHLDGTSLDSLGTVNSTQIHRAPTISPDGSKVAVQDTAGVKVIDVATKTATIVSTTCGEPRYSPDGASFACLNSRVIVVMKTDGTGARSVAPLGGYSDGWEELSGPDWTADGKWIVSFVGGQGPVMFEVATGASFPLSKLANPYPQPSFVR
jgi:Tol biopolymer transport system component